MRATTTAGARLKRLAQSYAEAFADLEQIGGRDPEDHEQIRARHRKSKKALHDAIDDATSIDLTPRAVSEES